MNYIINEVREKDRAKMQSRNAGGKARADVTCILAGMGMMPCEITLLESEREKAVGIGKLSWHIKAVQDFITALSDVCAGDTIFFQFPILNHSIFSAYLLSLFKRKGVNTVLLVHDLETLRLKKKESSPLSKARILLEERQALNVCTKIIVHNETMKRYLENLGISAKKMISLEIFDYLLPEGTPFDQSRYQKDAGVVIAGNLERKKSGYLYSLPEQVHWNLYGVGYVEEGKGNIEYKGSFLPEELIAHLEGGFGLVWDGPSAETCTGIYGDYLRINNPHKTSLYLAAGLPVIIWKEAALASFVEKNGVGLTVSSLFEIKDTIDSISDAEYEQMKLNARRIGMRLREGHYLRSAIEKI